MKSFQTRLCQLRIEACRSSISPNFSLDEVKQAVGELKLGRSADPTGMVREIFKKCNHTITLFPKKDMFFLHSHSKGSKI